MTSISNSIYVNLLIKELRKKRERYKLIWWHLINAKSYLFHFRLVAIREEWRCSSPLTQKTNRIWCSDRQWCKQILILEWMWAETHVFYSDLDLKSHRPVSSMYNTRSNLSTPMSALSSTFIDRAQEEKPKDYLYIYICVVSFFKKGRINTHICHKASCGNHSLQWSRALSLSRYLFVFKFNISLDVSRFLFTSFVY